MIRIVCLILLLAVGSADAATMVIKKKAAGGADAEIVAYFNCNANTADQPMTKGTGNTVYTIDFTAQAAVVDNGLYRAGGNGYQFQIPTASNFSGSLGTLGFFWRASTITALSIPVETKGGGSPYWLLRTLTATTLNFAYMDSVAAINAVVVAANNTYWVEFTWDYSNARFAYRVYNETTTTWIAGSSSTYTDVTGLTGSAPTAGGTLNFGNYDGDQNSQWFDQIMIANVYKKDLFSVRTSTSP